MAIVFPGSASSQILTNSSGVPGSALFSLVAWMRFTSASISYHISLDSATAGQYCLFGKIIGSMYIDWAGAGNTQTQGATVTTGTWYRMGAVINGTAATLYQGTASTSLTTYTQSANFVLPTGTLSWKLGGSTANGNNAAGDLACVKIWDTALTAAEIDQETWQYLPKRLTNISRWYPLVINETTDYSSNARTLSGGTGVTTSTDSGPPIKWGGATPRIDVPWDPTSDIWYAVYNTSDGSLYSVGTVLASPLDPSYAYKTYVGSRPDTAGRVWDANALDFINVAAVNVVDRVSDLLGEAGMAAVWADLSGTNSTTLQTRIGTLLGSYRYRYASEAVDLP